MFCWLREIDHTLITTLVSFVPRIKSFCSDFHLIHYMLCNYQTGDFLWVFKHNFLKEFTKFAVQYPSVSITKQQFPFIFTWAYELSRKMETVKSSFQATGIWLTDRINIDHNLLNPTIAYQNSEVTNNSWKKHC